MSPQPHWAGRNPGDDQGPPGPQGPPGQDGATTLLELTDVIGQGGTYGNSPTDDGSGAFPLTRSTTQDDLTAILNSVSEVVWHQIGDPDEPPFWNNFTNLGPPYAPLRYTLTLNNVVHIEGVITNPTPLAAEDANKVIFMLPPECLPGGNLAFLGESGVGPNYSGPSLSRLVVQGDGAVTWGGYVTVGEGAENYLSLCGINYRVQGANPNITAALAGRFQ